MFIRGARSVLAAALASGLACGAHAPPPDVARSSEVSSGADTVCLEWLDQQGVAYVPALALAEEVHTPIEVQGALGAVRLVPRAGRAPQMDCGLARALVEASPIFQELGVHTLYFSGAYDHRMRRDRNQLSQHAHGLAIDVHVLGTDRGDLDVTRDFEAGVGRWRDIVPGEGVLEACIGRPRTTAGHDLRALVCRLKLHSAFRVIATPDDDADHRDHLHLETFEDTVARVRRIVGVLPLRVR